MGMKTHLQTPFTDTRTNVLTSVITQLQNYKDTDVEMRTAETVNSYSNNIISL